MTFLDADVEDNVESELSRVQQRIYDTSPERTVTPTDLTTKQIKWRTSKSDSELGREALDTNRKISLLSQHIGSMNLNSCVDDKQLDTLGKNDIKPETTKTDASGTEVLCNDVGNDSSQLSNNSSPKHTKNKSERCLEIKLKATNTLASRYQASGHECSLLSCLNQFTSMELLTGNNKFGCEKCTKTKHKGKTEGNVE